MFNSSYLKPERYRYSFVLLKQLVKTDFKLRYQGSALGYLWSLLKPLALFGILYVVFSLFLKIGDGIENYTIYLLFGIVLWTYFAEVTTNAVKSMTFHGELLRKINFPKYVIVLAGSISAAINLAINLVVVAVFMYFTGIGVGLEALWLIPLVLELYLIGLALSFLLSASYVKYRDVSYIWELATQAGFYITPILYPLQIVPELAQRMLLLNPMAQIIQDARHVLVTKDALVFGSDNLESYGAYRLIPVGFVVVLLIASAHYFRTQASSFAENV